MPTVRRPSPRIVETCGRPRPLWCRALVVGLAVGSGAAGVTFDGESIWVSNQGDDTVTTLRAGNGAVLGTFAVGDAPRELAFDGSYVWGVNSGSHNVTRR